jgi:16S rRNA (uracil1498-N3)-methyltransferase
METAGTRGIAYCHGENRMGIESLGKKGPFTLLVGPEGDFTEQEVELALGQDYKPFHLGESRLRTETAAVYITAALSVLHKTA